MRAAFVLHSAPLLPARSAASILIPKLSSRTKKRQSEEIEIKKGYYKTETLQTGKRAVSTVSFIGNTGVLEF